MGKQEESELQERYWEESIMGTKKHNTKRKLYLRIFVALALSIAITMLILSTVLYVSFEKIALNQIYLANMKSLEQVNREVSNMASIASTISDQIYHDMAISKLLHFSQPDVFDMSIAVSQLNNYRLSIPFIDSICVYNSKTDTYYVEPSNVMSLSSEFDNGPKQKEGFYDTQLTEIIKNYKNYKPYKPIPRKFIYNNDSSTQKYFYTFFVYDMATGNSLDNAVIINISEAWVNSTMNDEAGNERGETFIVDDSGVVVSDSKSFPMMSDYSGASYIKKIFDRKWGGYFVDEVTGAKSLIVYTKPDYFGWRSVRIIPWDTIFHEIEQIRTVTVFIGLGMLVLGVLLSIFISGRLYIPIGNMLANLENLEFEKRKNARVLKQEFLRNMILWRGISSKTNLLKSYNSQDITIGFDSRICLLLLKIDRYNAFVQQYDNEDRNLYKFAVMNIACELLSPCCKTEAVDMESDSMVILMEASDFKMDRPGAEVEEQFKKLQSSVAESLKISVSLTVSTVGEGITSINQLYNQVTEASLHRVFYGHGSIIRAYAILQHKAKEYTFPIQKEKQLIDFLMGGKTGEARKMYDEMIREVSEYPITVYNHTISHLLFTLYNVMNTIKNNNSIAANLDFGIPVMTVNNAETIEEVNEKFYELFGRIEVWLEERKNSKSDSIVCKINEIIQGEYSNPGLSIDSIAESLGMSSAHICRLYKQHTLHTILEEIVQTRMKKARELLLSTEDSILEIAQKVGFSQSNYFYRVFKTENGVTPSDYRKNLKSST